MNGLGADENRARYGTIEPHQMTYQAPVDVMDKTSDSKRPMSGPWYRRQHAHGRWAGVFASLGRWDATAGDYSSVATAGSFATRDEAERAADEAACPNCNCSSSWRRTKKS